MNIRREGEIGTHVQLIGHRFLGDLKEASKYIFKCSYGLYRGNSFTVEAIGRPELKKN